MSHFAKIEKYIRDIISNNHEIFNKDSIIKQSGEWIQKFPVEFNSILNFIENEGRNDEMNDAPSSVAFGSRFADDSTSSVANMPDHISSVSDSPMGSDHIDSSPGGYPDDDFDSYMPLQRTMSSATPRN
jgi:hypothetical protein